MKIGILTWHKALNHGAVLQAYATQNFLKQNGIDSLILDYERNVKNMRGPVASLRDKIRKAFSGYLKDRQQILWMDKEKKQLFAEFIDTHLATGGLWGREELDLLIIGSDMVFNLKQGYSPYMFGIGVNAKRVMSYAACAGGTDARFADKLGLHDVLGNKLAEFSAIGVRDQETELFVNQLCPDAVVTQNIDPVLLYGFRKETECWNSGKWEKHAPYMLIYAYHGSMDSQGEVKKIKEYARKNGLKLVSCGYYHAWCDENVNAGPKEFVEMMSQAEYVVTDTFHGTVFAIINQKPFASIIRGNGFKLRYLLESCSLENRIMDKESISSTLSESVDYTVCNEWLKEQRKISGEFLRQGCLQPWQ